jgi:hypothetical protein
MTTPEQLKADFATLHVVLEEIEKDLVKSLDKGNSAAGRRARAGLRDLKKKCSELIKQLVELNKAEAK